MRYVLPACAMYTYFLYFMQRFIASGSERALRILSVRIVPDIQSVETAPFAAAAAAAVVAAPEVEATAPVGWF